MTKTYFPIHVHSMYSLLDGLSKPEQIADRITDCELPGCALTDHGSISGSVQFLQKMDKADKKPITNATSIYGIFQDNWLIFFSTFLIFLIFAR